MSRFQISASNAPEVVVMEPVLIQQVEEDASGTRTESAVQEIWMSSKDGQTVFKMTTSDDLDKEEDKLRDGQTVISTKEDDFTSMVGTSIEFVSEVEIDASNDAGKSSDLTNVQVLECDTTGFKFIVAEEDPKVRFFRIDEQVHDISKIKVLRNLLLNSEEMNFQMKGLEIGRWSPNLSGAFLCCGSLRAVFETSGVGWKSTGPNACMGIKQVVYESSSPEINPPLKIRVSCETDRPDIMVVQNIGADSSSNSIDLEHCIFVNEEADLRTPKHMEVEEETSTTVQIYDPSEVDLQPSDLPDDVQMTSFIEVDVDFFEDTTHLKDMDRRNVKILASQSSVVLPEQENLMIEDPTPAVDKADHQLQQEQLGSETATDVENGPPLVTILDVKEEATEEDELRVDLDVIKANKGGEDNKDNLICNSQTPAARRRISTKKNKYFALAAEWSDQRGSRDLFEMLQNLDGYRKDPVLWTPNMDGLFICFGSLPKLFQDSKRRWKKTDHEMFCGLKNALYKEKGDDSQLALRIAYEESNPSVILIFKIDTSTDFDKEMISYRKARLSQIRISLVSLRNDKDDLLLFSDSNNSGEDDDDEEDLDSNHCLQDDDDDDDDDKQKEKPSSTGEETKENKDLAARSNYHRVLGRVPNLYNRKRTKSLSRLLRNAEAGCASTVPCSWSPETDPGRLFLYRGEVKQVFKDSGHAWCNTGTNTFNGVRHTIYIANNTEPPLRIRIATADEDKPKFVLIHNLGTSSSESKENDESGNQSIHNEDDISADERNQESSKDEAFQEAAPAAKKIKLSTPEEDDSDLMLPGLSDTLIRRLLDKMMKKHKSRSCISCDENSVLDLFVDEAKRLVRLVQPRTKPEIKQAKSKSNPSRRVELDDFSGADEHQNAYFKITEDLKQPIKSGTFKKILKNLKGTSKEKAQWTPGEKGLFLCLGHLRNVFKDSGYSWKNNGPNVACGVKNALYKAKGTNPGLKMRIAYEEERPNIILINNLGTEENKKKPQIAPIMESEPVIESEPIVENEPVIESEPIIENEPTVENEPIVENEPVIESEPIIDSEPAAHEAKENPRKSVRKRIPTQKVLELKS